jgi:hypothetical protein
MEFQHPAIFNLVPKTKSFDLPKLSFKDCPGKNKMDSAAIL